MVGLEALEWGRQNLAKGQGSVGEVLRQKPTLLHTACAAGQAEVTVLFLENKADVNAKDVSGVTPLDFAEDMGMYENVRALRAAGGERGEDL